MRLQRDILIPALDLMLILVVTFIISMFSVRFVSEKGLGKESYFPVQYAVCSKNIESISQILLYFAVILDKNNITVLRIEGKSLLYKRIYKSINEFSRNLKNEDVSIIYEMEESDFFGDVIRRLSKTISQVLVALES